MDKPLPFFNWSLKKALDTEPDSFVKAKVRIVYTILLISLLKAAIVISLGMANEQRQQVARASVAFLFYLSVIKVLLYTPSRIQLLTHIILNIGVVLVWTNVFVYVKGINLITLQFVFMIALSAFYTLGSRRGILYSIAGILPVASFLVFGGKMNFSGTTQEFASPGYEIIAMLNFVSLVISHYLFYEAFRLNIKEKEKLNNELQLSVASANKLAASKSNFLSTMSHELRTPLNSVVGIAEILLEDKPEERQAENLKILRSSALDLLSLINNVLDFNKIDSDKLELEATSFNLPELMNNVVSGLRVRAMDKKIDLMLDMDLQLNNINVVSDPTRLSQLIYNLAGNAIKFTDKGSVTIKLSCSNKTEDEVDVLFSVIDTGIGIHPDKHESIFQLFTQAESSTTRQYGGTGLGLAIVKQILGLFKSTLQLESSLGNGAQFYFSLRFKIEHRLAAVSASPASGSKTDLSHLKILIAEDNDVNRLIIKKQLEKLNVGCTLVSNGQLACEAFATGYYDAILMDLHMPVMDGYVAVKQIRSMPDPAKAQVHIIAFTASVTEQEQIFENGFNDFLYKPVNMNDLQDKLEKIALLKQGVIA